MKIMKFRKVISIFFVLVFLFTNMTTPVYAGGLIGLFGKKKLNPPTSYYEPYWNGDYIELCWEPVEGGGYEIIYNGKTYDVPEGHNWFDINPTEAQLNEKIIEGNIFVSTLPANNRSKQSDPIAFPYSIPKVNLAEVYTGFDAACLSKEKLLIWLKDSGFSPTVSEEDDCIIVKVSLKDEKNSGFFKGAKKVVAAAFYAAGDSVMNNAGNIGSYALENGEGVKDTIKKGQEAYEAYAVQGAKKGAADEFRRYITTDRQQHLTYVFNKGEEGFASKYMYFDYLKSGNPKPEEILDYILEGEASEFYDEDSKAYYLGSYAFDKYLKLEVKADNSNPSYERWVLKCTP